MITTNDEELYKQLLRLRSHGITKGDDPYSNSAAFANGGLPEAPAVQKKAPKAKLARSPKAPGRITPPGIWRCSSWVTITASPIYRQPWV